MFSRLLKALLRLCFIRENDTPVGRKAPPPSRKVAARLYARNMYRENQSGLNSELGSVVSFFGSTLSQSRSSLLGSSSSSFLFQVSFEVS